jgi:hypothetical protein
LHLKGLKADDIRKLYIVIMRIINKGTARFRIRVAPERNEFLDWAFFMRSFIKNEANVPKRITKETIRGMLIFK